MRSVRKRWTICTISILLIFYKTKEIARTEEHQETQLTGDGELSLSRSMLNSSDKIIQKSGSSIFHRSVEGWKINSSLVLEIRKNILRFLDAERDVSVVKSSFKPGDVIHYVLDRRRTLNISQDLHSLLPEVSPMKNRRFKTCAVVGNSGILLDSECGKEIDNHDFVISDAAESWEDRDKKRVGSYITMSFFTLHLSSLCSVLQRVTQTLHTDIGAIFYFGVFPVTGQRLPFPFPCMFDLY